MSSIDFTSAAACTAISDVPQPSFNRAVHIFRCALIAVLACVAFYSRHFDQLIEALWVNYLLQSPIFRHDSFEPALSTFCFGLFITLWMIFDFHVPSLQCFRIDKSGGNKAWKGREKALWNETVWYLLPWIVFDAIHPRRYKILVPASPTLYSIISDILLSLLCYDLFFFFGHYAFHSFSYVYKSYHKEHHVSHAIRATDAIRHTFVDGTFDVLCSVLALKLVKAHPLSRSLYNVVAIYLITEAHCGYDFPWMLHRVVPFNIVAGPVVHHIHHRLGNKNFGKFFNIADFIFGTLRLELDLKENELISRK